MISLSGSSRVPVAKVFRSVRTLIVSMNRMPAFGWRCYPFAEWFHGCHTIGASIRQELEKVTDQVAPRENSLKEYLMVGGWRDKGLSWLLVALALVLLMPSGQSLWNDEGFSVQYASPQPLKELVSRIVHDRGSESLMPLGMFSTWAGARLFGMSERGLRTTSAVWAAAAVFLMWRIGLLAGIPWLTLVFACHPFIWYYGGEARPYAMVIALGTGVLYALAIAVYSKSHRSEGLVPLLIFGPLLCATHVLGTVPSVAAAAVFIVISVVQRRRPTKREWLGIVVSVVAVLLVSIYYLWALTRGVETGGQTPFTFGIGSLLFSGYELLGFVGFGPGRFELRQMALEGGVTDIVGAMIRPAMIGGIALVVLYCHIFLKVVMPSNKERNHQDRMAMSAGVVAAVVVIATVGAAFVAGSPFWGRHLSAAFPFLLSVIVMLAGSKAESDHDHVNFATVLLISLLLVSSVVVRFNPEHSRDDYRTASRLAVSVAESGKSVWWGAQRQVAEYYGVRFCVADKPGDRECVAYVARADRGLIEMQEKPDLVLLSKPDIFDKSNAIREYLRIHGFVRESELMAFQIFRPANGG